MNTAQYQIVLPDPMGLSKKYYPRVRFEMPSSLDSSGHTRLLHSLFVEFFRKMETSRADWNEYNSFSFGYENGSEGGMGGFHVRGVWFDHCKLYGYDGSRTGQNYCEWKGFMIRNHEDQYSKTPIVVCSCRYDGRIISEERHCLSTLWYESREARGRTPISILTLTSPRHDYDARK